MGPISYSFPSSFIYLVISSVRFLFLLTYSYDEGGDKFGKKKKKLSAGALASIVISVVVLGLLALIVLFWMIRKKNHQGQQIHTTNYKI